MSYAHNRLLQKGVEYLDGQALKVAVNGAWISSKQYLLRMYFYESTAGVDYI